MQDGIRLDKYLVELGYFANRSRAEDAIKREAVTVNGQVITKAGTLINATLPKSVIKVQDAAQGYVSRAALKLASALEHFYIDVRDKLALDLGASTGGFTQILLQKGAKHVIALDVGHNQIADSLRNDARVTVLEGINARHVTRSQLGGKQFNLLVCDVSFISLKLALPASLDLALPGSLAVILVKPQFEAGKRALGKSGIIRDEQVGLAVAKEISYWFDNLPGWSTRGLCPSSIKGRDGNQEYILFGEKTCDTA